MNRERQELFLKNITGKKSCPCFSFLDLPQAVSNKYRVWVPHGLPAGAGQNSGTFTEICATGVAPQVQALSLRLLLTIRFCSPVYLGLETVLSSPRTVVSNYLGQGDA